MQALLQITTVENIWRDFPDVKQHLSSRWYWPWITWFCVWGILPSLGILHVTGCTGTSPSSIGSVLYVLKATDVPDHDGLHRENPGTCETFNEAQRCDPWSPGLLWRPTAYPKQSWKTDAVWHELSVDSKKRSSFKNCQMWTLKDSWKTLESMQRLSKMAQNVVFAIFCLVAKQWQCCTSIASSRNDCWKILVSPTKSSSNVLMFDDFCIVWFNNGSAMVQQILSKWISFRRSPPGPVSC